MTFVVAWKHDNHVYLCADSAITTYLPSSPLNDEQTSFGEATVDLPGVQVAETAIKIIRLDSAIAAYSGDVATSRSILVALRDELIHHSPEKAFALAIDAHRSSPIITKAKIVVAWPTGVEARAIAYNHDCTGTLQEIANDELVRFGGTDTHRDLTVDAIAKVSREPLLPQRRLSCVQSLLQSFGVNQNFMEQGIGGAYCGAYVSPTEIHWQDDIIYFIHQPNQYWLKCIICCVRDNAMIVQSYIDSTTKVFAENLSWMGADEWLKRWQSEVVGVPHDRPFNIVAFLTAGYPICTVVEMNGHERSSTLTMPKLVEVISDSEHRMELEMSPWLRDAIYHPATDAESGKLKAKLTYCEYAPPHEAP